MGLSSLPAPSEGFLCVILVNTALSVSIIKGLVRSILRIVGIRVSSPSSSSSPQSEEYIEDPSETFELHLTSSGSYIEEIRSRIPAIRFDSVCSLKTEHDCSVCLTQFEPESEVNHLTCGHVFHQDCLEKWLNYWNITCPLCRTPLMPVEETSCFWWEHFTNMEVMDFMYSV